MELIIVVALAVWIYTLQSKVNWLMKEVMRLGQGRGRRSEAETTSVPQAAAQVPPYAGAEDTHRDEILRQVRAVDSPPPMPAAYVPTETAVDRFFAWVKVDFMVKLGAFLLLCALGWFVSYAFANNWIGEGGRITLGLLAGAAFMVLGVWRIQTRAHQGSIFIVLGSTTVLLTVYAAREIYGFFTPMSALVITILPVIFVAFTSVRYDRRALALAGLILASIAPTFTLAGAADVTTLFTYLLLIVLGTLWVVYLRGWSILTLTAFVIVFLYGLPHLMSGMFGSGDRDIALLFSFVFTAIFFIANILGLIANENKDNKKAHIMIAFGTGLYLILWITAAAPEVWQSLLYVAWMLVFSVGSYIVYRVVQSRVPFYIYSATSLVLLAAATAAELSGPVLAIAYTVEVAALVLVTAHILGNMRIATRLSLLFSVPVLLSLESFVSSSWRSGVFHDDFFVLAVIGLTLACMGRFLYEKNSIHDEDADAIGKMHMIVGACYGLALIWLILHVPTVIGGETATIFTLIIYTVIGLIVHITGKREGSSGLAVSGGVLLGFVIAHLLLVEVWNMELSGKIITFLVVGLLLMSTAFIKRQKNTPDIVSDNDKVL